MKDHGAASIWGIGIYLPPDIRTNAWWPDDVVKQWSTERSTKPVSANPTNSTPGRELARKAMRELRNDPFKGSVERRIKPRGMAPSEMEIAAAREAIDRANVSADRLGLILTSSEGPDHLLAPNAPLIHHALGAPSHCLCTSIDGVCNAFVLQLEFASALIQTNKIEFALLIQSCSFPAVLRQQDPFSTQFGDGATAVVLGTASGQSKILALEHFADGSLYSTLLLGNSEGPWWDGHAQRVYLANAETTKELGISMPDFGCTALNKALERAGVSARELDFLATHQGTSWAREVSQTLIGAPQARFFDTFPSTASLGPSNVPICLGMGERHGLLRKGDLIGAWSIGAGTTFSALVARW